MYLVALICKLLPVCLVVVVVVVVIVIAVVVPQLSLALMGFLPRTKRIAKVCPPRK